MAKRKRHSKREHHAYTAGLVATDGTVHNGAILLRQTVAARTLVEKLAEEFGSRAYLIEPQLNSFSTKRKMGVRLRCPTTWKQLVPDEAEEYPEAYARGLVDGDGCIFFQGEYPRVSFLYNLDEDFLREWFQAFVDSRNCRSYDRDHNGNCRRINMSRSGEVIALLYDLYDGSYLHHPEKYRRARQAYA